MTQHKSSEPNARFDVILIGGGVSGLAAAVGLADHGLRPLVLERDTILGGRARSWTDKTTGDPVHIGPHIMLSLYPSFFRLVELAGASEKIVTQRGGHFITMVDGKKEVAMRLADLPPPMPFVPSVMADPNVGTWDKLSNFRLTLKAMALTEDDVLELDALDARTYLESMGVTKRYIDYFWAFVAMAILNVPLERCSAGSLMRFYKRLVGYRQVDVCFPDGGLGDLFAPGARARIEARGGVVRTGAEVVEILASDDGTRVHGVRLSDGSIAEACAVVSTLPPHELAPLVRPEWKERSPFRDLERFEPCPYVSVFVWFDRKLTDKQFWARAFREDDLNCDFYDLSNIHSGWEERPSLITSNIIYSHRAEGLDDAEIVRRTVSEIADYLPEAKEAKVVHSTVHRIPMAIHCPLPGTERLRPAQRSEIEGLYFCGDWVRTGLPSSMESAALSGFRVAEMLLAQRGVRVQLVRSIHPVEGFTRMVGDVRLAAQRVLGRRAAS